MARRPSKILLQITYFSSAYRLQVSTCFLSTLDMLPQNLQFSHRLQVSTISLSTEFWLFQLGIRLEIGSYTTLYELLAYQNRTLKLLDRRPRAGEENHLDRSSQFSG